VTTHFIKFTLPDDQHDLLCATQGETLSFILWDFDQWLREQIKYRDRNELQEVRDKLYEIMRDRGVNLDDLA